MTLHHARRGSGAAFRSGLYARVGIAEDVRAVVDLLLAAGAGWLDPRRDLPLLMLCGEALVRWSRAAAKLDSPDPTADAVKVYGACSQRALLGLGMLGFSPQSAANLGITRMEGWDRARRLTERTLGKYRQNGPLPSPGGRSSPPPAIADPAEADAS